MKKPGFSVTTIDSAPAALALIVTEKFDAIISDYLMPNMDCLEFLKQVRLHKGQLPFIHFTVRERKEVVILSINMGANYTSRKAEITRCSFPRSRIKF